MRSLLEAFLAFAGTDSRWRFLGGLLTGFLLLALAWTAAWHASLGLPVTTGDRTLAAWYKIKNDAAFHAGSAPKVVIGGGSNALYGIDASRMAASLGVPVVNFGTHAALNLDYLLWRLSGALKPGDVVILSLEWDHFLRGIFELNEVSGPYLLGADPDYLERLPWPQRLQIMMSSGWERILMPFKLSAKENYHVQKAFEESTAGLRLDALGDFKLNRPADKGPEQQRALDGIVLDPNLVLSAAQSLSNPVWKRLGSFIKSCRKKNIAVWIAFPSLMDSPAYRSERAWKVYQVFEKNFEALGARVLTRQPETLYPRNFFFDTVYHLQSDARAKRTDLIIGRMRRENALPAAREKAQ